MHTKKLAESNQRGQSLIEVCVGIIFLVMVILALTDLAVMILACSQNNSACRLAVSAAASGDPRDAFARAEVALGSLNKQRQDGLISSFKMAAPVESDITSAPQQSRDPNNARRMITYGGPVIGTATVTTEISVRPFVLQHVLRAENGLVTFRAKQSSPITYVMPAQLPQDEESQISSKDSDEVL